MIIYSGSELKAKREALNIPLEQVATETRIRLSILQDLEDEEYSELSSSAQTKGFLRIYADYLGLPSEEPENAESPEVDVPELPAEIQAEEESKPDPSTVPSHEAETTKEPEEIQEPEPEATIPPESESQKILAQLGRELSARRRYLNLEWDLIIEQTHLSRNTLRALESGDLDSFSAPLQFRKDLQTYARFLNLNVETVTIQYAEALQIRRFENLPSRKKGKAPKPASNVWLNLRRFFTLDLFFGTLLILGILGFLIWGISNMQERSDEEPELTETLPAIIDFILTTPTADELSSTPEPEIEEEVGIPTATAFFVQGYPEEGLRLNLHARQNLWIRVYSDNELSFVGRLKAGEVRSFTADSSLQLECNNISALEIAFQGAALEPDYRTFGSPARFYFDFDGVQELPILEPSQTPQFTPTPGAP